jgi:hypothetical protein
VGSEIGGLGGWGQRLEVWVGGVRCGWVGSVWMGGVRDWRCGWVGSEMGGVDGGGVVQQHSLAFSVNSNQLQL